MAQVPATDEVSLADGVSAEFTVPFLYLKEQEVFCTVNGVEVAFTFINAGLILLDAVPVAGATVRRYRSTEAFEPRHEFENGVPFLPRFIDENNKQFLYTVQEAINETSGTAAEALAVAEAAEVIAQAASDKVDAAVILSAEQLRLDLAASNGATKVGRGAGTVESALVAVEALNNAQGVQLGTLDTRVVALESEPLILPALLANTGTATARNITLLGDSISHGAFALNTFMHGWARILTRMVNAEVGGSSYGYANWATLGSGATTTTEIHNVSFGGPAWSGVAETSAEAAASPTGAALRAGGVGSTMTLGLPFFQNRAEVYYIQQPGGGTFTVTVNGVLTATVNTDGVLGSAKVAFNLTDASYGTTSIVLEQTVAGNVDIVGPAYLSSVIEPVLNNWSQSGRRLRYAGEAIISSLMAESSTLIMALGHNDQGSADSDDTYYAAFVQRITWLIQYAKQYNVKVVVPDFCWTAAEASRTRAELRRLAVETGGIYINLPKMIFSGDVAVSTTYLIDVLKMWVDGSHPNKYGHKWIAETVARAMGLSCCTKQEAIRQYDFWMPVPLTPATGVENSSLTSAPLTSAYKRSGDLILVKLFVEAAAGGAFPVASYALNTAFDTKSELSGAQGKFNVAYSRTDTGATVSVYSISSSGAITLNVLASYVNDQTVDFSFPIAPGTL